MYWRFWYFSIIGILFILYVFKKVKSNQFAEEKSIFWIIGGVLMLCLSVFPVIFIKLSLLLGVAYPPSLLFLLSIVFVVFISFRQDQEIALLSERVKELAQRNALLENSVEKLETTKKANLDNDNHPAGAP